MRANYRPGPEQLRVLRCVAAGMVVRGDASGTRRGMWQTYELHGVDVRLVVRSLARAGLVDAPLIGPPRVTADGWAALRDASI